MFLPMKMLPPEPRPSPLSFTDRMPPPPFPNPSRWREQAEAQLRTGASFPHMWLCAPFHLRQTHLPSGCLQNENADGGQVDDFNCNNILSCSISIPEKEQQDTGGGFTETNDNASMSGTQGPLEEGEGEVRLEVNEAWRKRMAATLKRKKKQRKDYFKNNKA